MLSRKFQWVIATAAAYGMLLSAGHAVAQDQSPSAKRAELDQMADQALDQLFQEEPAAQDLYEQAAGYAVFESTEVSAGLKAGGGYGVAVDKQTGERIYMNMSTGGLSLGLGGRRYNLVMLFETEEKFYDFVSGQWQGDVGASAVAGSVGAATRMSFREGVAAFPISSRGLLLEADLSGTRFSVNEELSRTGETQDEWREAEEEDWRESARHEYDPTRTKPGPVRERYEQHQPHVTTPVPPQQ